MKLKIFGIWDLGKLPENIPNPTKDELDHLAKEFQKVLWNRATMIHGNPAANEGESLTLGVSIYDPATEN